MSLRTHILSALLAILVAFTAQGAAVARTMPDAAGQMVLCTGSGPVMVFLDENGEPTAPPQLCPEYTAGLIVALSEPALSLASEAAWQRQSAEHFNVGLKVLSFGTPNARGPPVLI
jgi:hypothetical protein